MIAAVFIRRLKEGVTFEQFERAWEAEAGYGVPARVINAVSLEDPRRVLSIGFVAVSAEAMDAIAGRAGKQDEARRNRIDEVIESTELRAMYEVSSEHDFTAEPREIELGSAESLLAALAAAGIDDPGRDSVRSPPQPES